MRLIHFVIDISQKCMSSADVWKYRDSVLRCISVVLCIGNLQRYQVSGLYSSLRKPISVRAVERHLPYGITQCYLPLATGEPASL